jgi:hypothetical protein
MERCEHRSRTGAAKIAPTGSVLSATAADTMVCHDRGEKGRLFPSRRPFPLDRLSGDHEIGGEERDVAQGSLTQKDPASLLAAVDNGLPTGSLLLWQPLRTRRIQRPAE